MATTTISQLTYPASKCVSQTFPINFPYSTVVHVIGLKAPEGFSILHVESDATKTETVVTINYNPFEKFGLKRKKPTSTAAIIEFVRDDPLSDKKETVELELIVEPDIDDSEALSCGVCTRRYSESFAPLKPRILTRCGHNFCTDCLTEIEQEHAVQKTFDIACPTCRLITKSAAHLLPYSWGTIKMLQEQQQLKQEKDIWKVDDPMIPCFENEQHESAVYCQGCEETYCIRCFPSAHSNKYMINHTSIPVGEKPAFVPKCPTHPDKEIEFVCPQSDCRLQKYFCSSCKSHGRHKVVSIARKIEVHRNHVQNRIDGCLKDEKAAKQKLENWKNDAFLVRPGSKNIEQWKKVVDAVFEVERLECHKRLPQVAAQWGNRCLNGVKQAESELIGIQNTRRSLEKTLKRKMDLWNESCIYNDDVRDNKQRSKDGVRNQLDKINVHIRGVDISFPECKVLEEDSLPGTSTSTA